VGETDAERNAIIERWYGCMKEHGADTDTMPPNIKGSEQWMDQHRDATDACQSVTPLPPWGVDRDNPERRSNILAWVKCMNDRGDNLVATPDDEQRYWRPVGDTKLTPEQRDRVESECEMETIGKSDR
jgi:hypothetical protein